MADYFKILTSAIEQQGIDDPDARKALYDRVRNVLETQLKDLDPDKAAPIAAQHRKTLDDAIARIEAAVKTAAPGPGENSKPDIAVTATKAPASGKPPEPPASTAPGQGAPTPSVDPGPDGGKPQAPATRSPGGAYVAPPQRTPATPAAGARQRPTQSGPAGGHLRPPTPSERMAAKPKRGGIPTLAIVLLVVAAGLAGFGFWQRDGIGLIATALTDRIGSVTGFWLPEEQRDVQDTSPAPAAASGQVEEQVSGGSQEEPEGPTGEAPAETAPQQSEQPGEERVADANEQNSQAPVASGQVGSAPERPSAFLLIEGNVDAGEEDRRIEGSTNWLLVGNGGTLRAEVNMPGEGSSLVIDIEKNSDAGLPASHTVTYTYTPGESQTNGPITNFPAIMTRDNDESESVALRGVGALIVPNQYLMGLSNKPEDRAFNKDRLEKAHWIVLPVVFENERRGLFVVEMGVSGREAYNSALGSWGETGGETGSAAGG